MTINYTEADFEDEVKELTDGRGVALVLECVGGPVLEKSVRCVASYGRAGQLRQRQWADGEPGRR